MTGGLTVNYIMKGNESMEKVFENGCHKAESQKPIPKILWTIQANGPTSIFDNIRLIAL